eukprot:NODE_1032_length_1697_cov_74.580892_g878_i1.p1 GENE.NODE_1032_length_1697_cov_74.580892_g878_i1~~NODE_1032_length_1697_cov_74.580892_g878_i1.p1  ORF type:complete len:449 (+),score=140.32 NODE_1032_length_1697_cov_74.580892_g878_i1:46-1347(+)
MTQPSTPQAHPAVPPEVSDRPGSPSLPSFLAYSLNAVPQHAKHSSEATPASEYIGDYLPDTTKGNVHEQLLACQQTLADCEEEKADLKREIYALQCQLEEHGEVKKPVPQMRAGQFNPGSKRYDDISSILNFVSLNINMDCPMVMQLQGRILLNGKFVPLGRVWRYKLDHQNLSGLYICIPEEDVENMIALIRQLILKTPVDPAVLGKIAADWTVITDVAEQGQRASVYVLNESAGRTILINDWPHCGTDIEPPAPVNFSALFGDLHHPTASYQQRCLELTQFLLFLAANITLTDAYVFEPTNKSLVINDRVTRVVPLTKLCRFRMNGGGFDSLFLSMPVEEKNTFLPVIEALVLNTSICAALACEMAKFWRIILNSSDKGAIVYVFNETLQRVMVLASWPDDTVLGLPATRPVNFITELLNKPEPQPQPEAE